MKENFYLRFNLNKCGVSVEDSDTALLAKFAGLETSEAKKNLELINLMLKNSIEKVKETVDSQYLCTGKTILFLGDSLTSDRLSYMNIIKGILDAKVVDGATSGANTSGFVAGIDYTLDEVNPDMVHILLGTNDIPIVGKDMPRNVTEKDVYIKNISHIIDRIGKNRRVIISTIPPLHMGRIDCFLPNKVMKNSVIEEYNIALKELASQKDCELNDTWKYFREEDYFFEPDGVHLSPEAHIIFAENLINFFKG